MGRPGKHRGARSRWLHSFPIYLDICPAQWEGDGEEGEAQSPGVTVTPEHTMAHCAHPTPTPGSPSSSTTPSTQRPVYLPPGPGSISGATSTGLLHRHCQALCPRGRAWQQGSSLHSPPSAFVLPHSLPPTGHLLLAHSTVSGTPEALQKWFLTKRSGSLVTAVTFGHTDLCHGRTWVGGCVS